MPGDSESQSAHEQLDDSVDRALRGDDERESGLTEYVLVAAREVVDNEGDVVTTYDVIVGSRDLPVHSALGLIEFAKQHVLHRVKDEHEE